MLKGNRKMSESRDYWRERERDQSALEIERDSEVADKIQKHYDDAIDEADKEITRLYDKYADDEGMSLSDAQKRIEETDIEHFEEKAARYVENNDFSDQANREMRQYNVRMRTSRLELMQKYASLEIDKAAGLSEIEVESRLEEIARSEVRRQSGILGETINLSSEALEGIVRHQFKGEYFSDRIWQNRDILVDNVDRQMRSMVTQGRGPRELARSMRQEMGGGVYNTERIMRTESARVASETQKKAYEDVGVEEFENISESDACDDCLEMNGTVHPVSEMQPGDNASPFHPNCKCATMPVAPDD